MTVKPPLHECLICRRPRIPSSEFCSLHSEAMRNLEKGRQAWCLGLGKELTKPEYFEHLLRLMETGSAAKEVIGYLQRKASGAD